MGSLTETPKNAGIIEEEFSWKEFVIRPATNEDYLSIITHLRSTYYVEEPCHKLLGWTEEKADDLDLIISHFLNHGLSLVAIHKPTNQLAGVRIVFDGRRKLDYSKMPLKSNHVQLIQVSKSTLLANDELHRKNNDPNYNLTTDEVPFATGFIASTDPSYRGMGLATEMHIRSLQQLRASGIKLIKSFFSSFITVKIAKELGYEERGHLFLAGLVQENGEKYFPTAPPPPAHRITYMLLHLS